MYIVNIVHYTDFYGIIFIDTNTISCTVVSKAYRPVIT